MSFRSRMNLVDAISFSVPTLAKARTALTRVGIVKALTPAPFVTVTVSGNDVVAHKTKEVTPVVGDQVLILVDAGMWVIIGRLTTTP